MTIQNTIIEAEALADQLEIGAYDLYARVGVNASTWMRWKRGTNSPTLTKYQRLLQVMTELRQEIEEKKPNGQTGEGGG